MEVWRSAGDRHLRLQSLGARPLFPSADVAPTRLLQAASSARSVLEITTAVSTAQQALAQPSTCQPDVRVAVRHAMPLKPLPSTFVRANDAPFRRARLLTIQAPQPPPCISAMTTTRPTMLRTKILEQRLRLMLKKPLRPPRSLTWPHHHPKHRRQSFNPSHARRDWDDRRRIDHRTGIRSLLARMDQKSLQSSANAVDPSAASEKLLEAARAIPRVFL